ncbi:MAG: hypothetical protein HIU84_00555 [Acidobacteria bacterium]|nr:hypothetical protein [Acidobacteriota bacterium]
MSLVWTVVLFVHVSAATFWVGGQLMLVFVVMPLLRRTAPPEVIGKMARMSGRRFATISNFGLFPALLVTGPLLAWHDGVRLHDLTGAFDHVLEVKVFVVVVVLGLAGAHGGAAKRLSRRGVRTLALLTVALSVLIVALAAALAILPTP